MSGIPGRRLTIGRDRQRLRGLRRRARALQVWAARFEGFFPSVSRNGFGDRNWHTRLPVAQRAIAGPRASRHYQRACLAATLAVVAHLRRAKPAGAREIRVVALIPVDDLFAVSIDVFWGDEDFFRFFDRSGPHQAWTRIADPGRSLFREWGLEAGFGEVGYGTVEQWDADGPVSVGELWVVGDVAGL